MRCSQSLVVAVVAALLVVGRAHAAADPVAKCRLAVLRGAAKLAHARLVSLRKCEEAKRAGKLSPLAVCRDDGAVVSAVAKATSKLTAAVEHTCGGADKHCGGSDDVTLAAMHWPSICPELEGSGCAAPLASCADLPACVGCLADAAVTRGLALVYVPFIYASPETAPDPKLAKAIVGCQKALGAGAAELTDARLAVEGACLAGRLAGKHDGACPLPGDGTAAKKLTAARDKAEAKICKACGGADKQCGGEIDLSLASVGVVPACPGVGTCDPTVASIADLVACFDCTAAFRSECALTGAAPGVADSPAGCAVAPPTPTPTVTPVPSETPVASPTLSATPTPTPPPIFCAAADAGTATTTLTITLATGGTPVSGADLVLDYDPHLVRLPGAGDDPGVSTRVVDLTGHLLNKGAPNNQDTNADREPDRMRFTLVSIQGVTGDILKVVFDRCSGAGLTAVADYTCAVSGAVGADAVTPVPTTCTLAITQAQP
jgi:hypothetical protein